MKKINIALVGTWHDHSYQTYKSICNLDFFNVLGIAEPLGEVSERFKDVGATYCVDELLKLKELDAVCIECDEENATKYAQIFAEANIAVHLDKPGSQDVSAFEKLINTVKKNNVPFQMGYMYRYNPIVQRCIGEVRQGKLGEIFGVEAHMSVCHTAKKQKWLGKFKGGMMYYLGCHLVDLILQIQGTPERKIPLNKCSDEKIPGAENFGFAVFEYKNGCSFIKACGAEVNGFDRRQLVVTGSKGTFEIKPFETMLNKSTSTLISRARVTYSENVLDIWKDCSEEVVSGPVDRYDPMMTDFADFIRGEKKNPYTYDYELQLFKTVMKCCNIL